MSQHQHLSEGLEMGDLKYLVSDKIHIDEYNSKMGSPDDVITLSFKVRDIMPANDLVNYLESGYDWILDADVSTGEITDSERLVFVEAQRSSNLFKNIKEMLGDLDHLTGIKMDEWKFTWYKSRDYQQMNEENFNNTVPTDPSKYEQALKNYELTNENKKQLSDELSRIKKLSGID